MAKNHNKNILLLILIFSLVIINNNFFKNNIKICLCVVAKNENLYLREFVEHYKKIGYNKIFLYDNNEPDGENFNEVIYDYIKSGFVKVINYRKISVHSNPQADSYKDCYKKNNKLYDWLSFYDIDELLEINEKYKTIQDFLKEKIFEHCQNIKINWFMHINKNGLYYENKPLKQRKIPSIYNHSSNNRIKSTVKGNLPVNYWKEARNFHTSILNITCCSSSGKKIEFDSPSMIPPDYTNAKLNHYYYKSFEEFCLKLKRGVVDRSRNRNKEIIKKNYKNLYNANKNDSEKLKIIHKIFNNSFI